MLCLSQTTGYAILALSCLDSCGARWMLARDIARCTGISLPYLSKMLHALGGSGLIEAKRGYRGGFRLARPADQISLLAVAEAVEGADWLAHCLLGLEECSDQRACPTHDFWKAQRQKIQDELQRLSLRDVAEFERAHGQRLDPCACEDQR
jgi:Rrf2 family transcriptional regulator, iron-sulfur cluster assembly transcription factor